ncbi:hypothetical protein D4765_18405 [Subtercola vilae]|uniref:Uncharacterized protein n=1 Tax=Subtercola vilae TaxID=2056433 RepID=A0A4T2BEG3_9MICO|nr:hypothetical protein D4765_18405 [Subtercola vilae]
MVGDGPIRISALEWVVIRNNPRYPKALIRRVDPDKPTEHYRVVTFDIDPSRRELLGRYGSLSAANDSVHYELPTDHQPASHFGMYENRKNYE